MSVEVDDYQRLFGYLHRLAERSWRTKVKAGKEVSTRLDRVHWYGVGSIDEWNLSEPQTYRHLRRRFDSHPFLKAAYMAQARKAAPGESQADAAERAWAMRLDETEQWYQARRDALAKVRGFNHAVRTSSDRIAMHEVGRWTVDLLNHDCGEKGLMARLAADMVALEADYDVAVLVSNDDDCVPAMDLMKSRGKQVGAMRFLSGSPADHHHRRWSLPIALHADFVVRAYATDLVAKQAAAQAAPKARPGAALPMHAPAG